MSLFKWKLSKVLFCKQFPFHDHHNIKRVIELNHVRDCIIKVSSENDFLHADNAIRVLGAIEDLSLMVIDRKVEFIDRDINRLRFDILQMLCLDRLNREEVGKEDGDNKTINGKK